MDDPEPGWLVVTISPREERPVCGRCGTEVWVKDYREVDLVDLPAFDQRVVLRVQRTRWRCPRRRCGQGSWTVEHPEIAPARHKLTTRAGRAATERVGRCGHTVHDVAGWLGTDWHTVNDTVVAYGEALLEADVDRIGTVRALSLDETLFKRDGPWRTQCWSTQITDARRGQLLEVMDMSGPYKAVFDTMLPDAEQVIDPFHVVRHANAKLDECRRRVRTRPWGIGAARPTRSTAAASCYSRPRNGSTRRLDEADGLLRAGDPHGEVAYSWHAKKAVRFLYDIPNPDAADRYVAELADDLQDPDFPPEVRSLGRTLLAGAPRSQTGTAPRATNGPAEAINNLVKRVKRVAFGFRHFRNYRIRSLLYAGQPDWALLPTITPR